MPIFFLQIFNPLDVVLLNQIEESLWASFVQLLLAKQAHFETHSIFSKAISQYEAHQGTCLSNLFVRGNKRNCLTLIGREYNH